MQQPNAVVAQQKLSEIYVASENFAHGTEITKERFKKEKWPSDRLPEGAVTDFKEVEGKYTNQPLYAGEPLLLRKTMNSADFISTKIPPGYRLFDMPIGDSDYIRPGDHVDIFGYFQKSSTISQTRSMRVLQNVTVLMVDGVTVRQVEDAGSKSAKTAQLLIKDSQYEALTTASNLGKLRLALCGHTSEESTDEDDNGEAFLSWVDSSVGEGIYAKAKMEDAPQQQVLVDTPAEPVDERERHTMVVYSGGIAHQYEWFDDELPTEIGAPAKSPNQTPKSDEQPAPTGKFTGTNTVWDPMAEEWTESHLNEGADTADALQSP